MFLCHSANLASLLSTKVNHGLYTIPRISSINLSTVISYFMIIFNKAYGKSRINTLKANPVG